jgi:hypothetical protein
VLAEADKPVRDEDENDGDEDGDEDEDEEMDLSAAHSQAHESATSARLAMTRGNNSPLRYEALSQRVVRISNVVEVELLTTSPAKPKRRGRPIFRTRTVPGI